LRRRSESARPGYGGFPELKLSCRVDGKPCSKCCYETEMPLTREDIERIERLGYRREELVVVGDDGIPRLRNIDGHCVFLDPRSGRCKIYPWRPLGCRLYPLVYDPCCGVTVDPECPLAHTIGRGVVEKLAPYLLRLIEEIYGKTVEEIEEALCGGSA
jgi:Fe-S-cluster containining protein